MMRLSVPPVVTFVAVLAAAFLAGYVAHAHAAVPVELVSHPQSRGAQITLADLFDGAEGPSGTVVVGTGALPGQSAVLDAARVQIAAQQAGLEWDNAHGLRRIIVAGGAAEAEPAPVRPVAGQAHAAAARRTAAAATVQAVIYTHNIAPGEAISASDLQWAEVPAASHLADPIADIDAAAGKIARRPLRSGAPALGRDLIGAKVIHKDDIVAVVFRDDGMMLSLQGKALGDASAGEPVQVMNVNSKKIIEAVATAPGQAAVGPEAEASRLTHVASIR